MLAITANWRLTDGSLAASRVGQASGWLRAVHAAVARAGCGRDGRYRPVAHLCLVFAGDTYDWLLSDVWHPGDRPWHGGERGRRGRRRAAVAAVMATRPVLREVIEWARRGLTVPAADGRGRPSTWAKQKVPLRLVLLAGDRDRWVGEWAGPLGRLGIDVGEAWSDGVRDVRHGHDRDPLAWHPSVSLPRGDRQPTFAESLALDLVVPFAVAARRDERLWPVVRPRLSRFAAEHPAAWPKLIGELIAEAGGDATAGRGLLLLWQRQVAEWFAVARRELPACDAEFDAVAAFAGWFEQTAPEAEPPAALRRLTAATAGRPAAGGAFLAHPGGDGSPTLDCHLAAGRNWREHLDRPPPGPAVLAIGGGAVGSGFVDAA